MNGRRETQKQRWDRNFADLLQELRVAQTGVQILFAFLLTLPFSGGFPRTTAAQKDIYLLALMAAAFSAALIIAPVAFHRALFRQGRKPELVRYAHRMLTAGLGFMLLSMVSSIFLVTDYLVNLPTAIILTAVAAAFFLTFWVGVPLFRHHWIEDEDEREAEDVGGVDVEAGEEVRS